MTRIAAIALGLALSLALAACGEDPASRPYQGYVEGEFLLVGAKVTGQLATLDVAAGDAVEAGDRLFGLDPKQAEARRTEAAARLEQAEAELQNLLKGKRPLEIAVIEAQVDEARARLALADAQYKRIDRLTGERVASQSQLDDARMSRDVAKAELERLKRELETARLPAREDEIEASRRNVNAARATLDAVATELDDLTQSAPRAGRVQEIFYREGEIVPAGRPVVSLLPPDNRKIRFFVPEAELSAVSLGEEVTVSCDGCPQTLRARISFVSDEAEYTPPVIFSVESRNKLVYKVEAVPSGPASALKPGQPVDVALSPGGP